jgi:hypothetical protein
MLLIKTDIRHVLLAVLAGATLSLLPLLVLGLHAFPSADDYCVAVEARRGFWQMQAFFYTSWTGRYAPTFLQTIMSSWDLASVYPWFCTGTVLATFLALRSVIASVCPPGTPGLTIAAAASVGMSVFLGRLPSSTEAFLWMTSAITYQWGLIGYLFWLSWLIRIDRNTADRPGPLGPRVAAAALTVVLPGFCEVLIPVILLTLAGFVVAGWRRGRGAPRFMLSLLIVTVVAAGGSVLAPGNSFRSSTYPDNPTRHSVEFALVETARQTVRFIANFGLHPALWVAASAAWRWGLPTLTPLVNRMGVARASLAGIAGLLSGIYITLFPLYWEYGDTNYTGEGRTYNITYIIFIVALLLGIGAVLGKLAERWPMLSARQGPGPTRVDWLLAGALVLLLLASPGTLQAFRAAKLAPEYLKFQQTRESVLKMPEHQGGALIVSQVEVQPVGLFWGDIQPDDEHWINTCVARYYGLGSVRTPTPDPLP